METKSQPSGAPALPVVDLGYYGSRSESEAQRLLIKPNVRLRLAAPSIARIHSPLFFPPSFVPVGRQWACSGRTCCQWL
jgi:hypothetical protein